MASVSPGPSAAGGSGAPSAGRGRRVSPWTSRRHSFPDRPRWPRGPRPRCRHDRAKRRNRASRISSLAPEFFRICASCGPREPVLIGTSDDAHPAAPSMMVTNSMRLPQISATRSPRWIAGRAPAFRQSAPRDRAPRESQIVLPLAVTSGLSRNRFACVSSIVGKVRSAGGEEHREPPGRSCRHQRQHAQGRARALPILSGAAISTAPVGGRRSRLRQALQPVASRAMH